MKLMSQRMVLLPLLPCAVLLLLLATPAALSAQSEGSSGTGADSRAKAYYHYAMGHHYEEMAGLSRRRDYLDQSIEQFKLALKYEPGSHKITVRLAEAYRRSGRIRDAVEEMQALLKADPGDLSARRVLGRIYYQTLGDSPESARGRATLPLAVEQYEAIVKLAPDSADDLLTLAKVYRFSGELEKAEQALGRLLDADPGSEDGMSELAYIYLTREDNQQAIDLLQGTAVNSSSTELLARLAFAYQQKGDLESAIQIYRQALRIDGNNIRLRGSLADLLARSGKSDEALSEYQAIEAVDEGNLVVLLRIAQTYRDLGRLSEAEEVLDRARNYHPGNIDVTLNRALLKEAQGEFASAAELLQGALGQFERTDGRYTDEEAGRRAALLEQLGVLHRRDRKFEPAIGSFEAMRDLGDQHRYRAWVQVIETHRQARALTAAIAAAREALKDFDNDTNFALQLAGVLGEAGQVEEALDIVDSQEGGGSDPFQLQITLFQIYERNRMFDKALEAVDGIESIGREGLDSFSHYLRGSIYYRMEDLDQAERAYRRALEIDPGDAGTLNDFGYMLADNDRKLGEALKFLQTAVKQEPNNAAYLDSLAWAHFKLKHMEEAERYLLQAIERNSSSPTQYFHLGEVYYATKRFLLAQKAWERASQLWDEVPENDIDREERAKLEEKLLQLRSRLVQGEPSGKQKRKRKRKRSRNE